MFSSVSEYIKAMGDTIEDIKKSSVARTLKSISKNEDTLKPSIERSSSTNYKVGDKLIMNNRPEWFWSDYGYQDPSKKMDIESVEHAQDEEEDIL